jgi:hypothetical protein
MIVVYRDNGGLVAVEVDTTYNIAFLDSIIMFDGLDGKSYKIPVKSLVVIDIKREV